ncbi:MAG: S8 family serine peptidase [Pseudomonadota bacterium]
MATRKRSTRPATPSPAAAPAGGTSASSSMDDLMLAALARNDGSLQTGRYLVTFKDGALEAGMAAMAGRSMRVADARDFEGQAMAMADTGDADAVVFPEIGVALIGGAAAQEQGMAALASGLAEPAPEDGDSAIEVIEPEYFVFADGGVDDYLRGFLRATETIARDLGQAEASPPEDDEASALVLGNTWGLVACRVPPSTRSGAGMRVAVLDTGMDLGHPDFAGRVAAAQSFVGQPVQDLHSHGTHCIGTACGPRAPAGTTPRYGVAYGARIYVGKVLSNAGGGSTASVLAGMNWAIANKCAVISMSLGSQAPVQAAYTAAGAQALAKGCLVVAAAGNDYGAPTGAPANSPTIMAVASLDRNLAPSNFSNQGKIQIAAPGRDVFSSVPRPTRYGTKSGTSMATPHVAGCAALWAQTASGLRGMALWNRLLATARPLPYAASKVGRGLVQAP